jgi:hypothetical protein
MNTKALAGVACALLLVGCATKQSKATVLISDGCSVYVDGITGEQASSITRTWDIKPECDIEIKTELK